MATAFKGGGEGFLVHSTIILERPSEDGEVLRLLAHVGEMSPSKGLIYAERESASVPAWRRGRIERVIRRREQARERVRSSTDTLSTSIGAELGVPSSGSEALLSARSCCC